MWPRREVELREFQPQLREDFLRPAGREIGVDRRDAIACDEEFQVPEPHDDPPSCGINAGQCRQYQVSRLRAGHCGDVEYIPALQRQALFMQDVAVERPVRERRGDRLHKGDHLRFAYGLRENVLADDVVRQVGSKAAGIFPFPGLYGGLHVGRRARCRSPFSIGLE